MTETIYSEKVAEKYGELLRDGLSSTGSYVILHKKSNRTPFYLCLKPRTYYARNGVLMIGGKLSVFWDPEKGLDVSDEDRVEKMTKAYPKLPHDRVSARRVGSNIGVFISATPAYADKVVDEFIEESTVSELLDEAQKLLDFETTDRRKVVNALKAIFTEKITKRTDNSSFEVDIQKRKVGKMSDVIFGQGNLEPWSAASAEFAKKVGLPTD